MNLTEEYWDARYQQNNMPWQLDDVNPLLPHFLATYKLEKDAAILIPGAGMGTEAIYLARSGFTNITVVDIAATAVSRFTALCRTLGRSSRFRESDINKDEKLPSSSSRESAQTAAVQHDFDPNLISVLHQDFFKHTGSYDLIWEQTFYCALDVDLRDKYVAHMHDLLHDKQGTLAGVLFNFPLTEKGPPYGGSQSEYRNRLDPKFDVIEMAPTSRSTPSRLGKELFFVAQAKAQ